MKTAALATLTIAALLAAAGCEKKPAANTGPMTTTRASTTSGAVLPAGLFLDSAPADAKTVEDLKATKPKVGDTVAISGRVGGSRNPFVDGRAVLTLVGPGIKACSDTEGDGCKTPWDYCCDSPEVRAAHSATIQVVDADGAPLRANLKGEKGLKELSKVTVVGKVVQAEGSVLVINATGMHIN